MDWIYRYQLFLFDFDGLLVDTESLHYRAYLRMCAARGRPLNWDFSRFCQVAHESADGLKRAIFPLFAFLNISWEELYREKQRYVEDFFKEEPLRFMPGVLNLIKKLKTANIPSCVVTNSTKKQVDIIYAKMPELQLIDHWITREDYSLGKPNPESYLKAIELYGQKKKKIIGFEDSYKGYRALSKTRSRAVLICPLSHPQLEKVDLKKIIHFEGFDRISRAP